MRTIILRYYEDSAPLSLGYKVVNSAAADIIINDRKNVRIKSIQFGMGQNALFVYSLVAKYLNILGVTPEAPSKNTDDQQSGLGNASQLTIDQNTQSEMNLLVLAGSKLTINTSFFINILALNAQVDSYFDYCVIINYEEE